MQNGTIEANKKPLATKKDFDESGIDLDLVSSKTEGSQDDIENEQNTKSENL